jgi:selenide,water dikinase
MTDITGFGLIGHARELALASQVSLRLYAANIPLLPGAIECLRAGYVPGGLKNNRDFAEGMVEYAAGLDTERKTLLYDPQTAGGLLISLESAAAKELVCELQDLGLKASHIGDVEASTKSTIKVV